MPKEQFKESISKVKIPILILDNKWHRLFGKINPSEELIDLEKKLAKLIKEQGKITNEQKELKKIKSGLMQGIVENMDDSGASVEKGKKLDENKRLINETNDRLAQNEDRLLDIPAEIDDINKQLMLKTMDDCYSRLQNNTKEIEEIAKWIKDIRVELKKNVVKKQDMEIDNAELYSYMHDIFGPDVMEIFDMKYVPKKHNLPELKDNPNIKADTDSNGNKLVE